MAVIDHHLKQVATEYEKIYANVINVARIMNSKDDELSAVKCLVSYNPNNEEILDKYPQYQSLISKIIELRERYMELIEQSEDLYGAHWMKVAYCYLILGDFPNAFAAVTHFLKIAPSPISPYDLYYSGIIYSHFKYYDKALRLFQCALSANSQIISNTDILMRLCLIYRELGDYAKSHEQVSLFVNIRSNQSNNLADFQFQDAYTSFLEGDFQAAFEISHLLYKQLPMKMPIIRQYSIISYLIVGPDSFMQFKETLHDIREGRENDPTLGLIEARLLTKMGAITLAFDELKSFVIKYSESPFYWNTLGCLYFSNEQYEEALWAFQRALYLKPEYTTAWLNIGAVYEARGEIEAAAKIYRTGMNQFAEKDFSDRLSILGTQLKPETTVIDSDDRFLFQFDAADYAHEYLKSIPVIHPDCLSGNITEEEAQFFSTVPKSILSY